MESTLATLAVRRGGLPALAFVASHQALLPRAKALWGEHDAGGSPRWRSAIAVPMQLALLPALIAYAFAAGGGTMAGWRARWEADWNSAQASGACPAEWAFVNIFAAFLLVDFVNYRIRTVMIAHHVVCLIGHFGALSAPAAFVDYFAAAVACELGSAVCNLNALYPRSGAAPLRLVVRRLARRRRRFGRRRRARLGPEPARRPRRRAPAGFGASRSRRVRYRPRGPLRAAPRRARVRVARVTFGGWKLGLGVFGSQI